MRNRNRPRSNLPASGQRLLRCAVYTRKSSEEGLEQSFNSLHAQRDACEAYVASQKHEGWVLVPTAYDDGGLSGGSMERPSLQRLLDDVRRRMIDVVVVYKVDRLTRSLADFAKLTELFDEHSMSFVSVTQQFNTSTSMGRLTLNVLLSFAQFEREVTGERIRDKIALSKRRGMWMGGLPPLGYDGVDRKLVINSGEAESVRTIFRSYLELGSIAELKRFLDERGVRSKRRLWSGGRTAGGMRLSRGALYQILRNRLYRGEIEHLCEVHPGNHEAIVDADLWTAVQDHLVDHSARRRGTAGPGKSGSDETLRGKALLAGLVADEHGNRLTPTYAIKNARRYHYYVSAPLVRGSKEGGIRVPAPDLEHLVIGTLSNRLTDALWVAECFTGAKLDVIQRMIPASARLGEAVQNGTSTTGDGRTGKDLVRRLIEQVTVGAKSLAIRIDRSGLTSALGEIDPELVLPIDAGKGIEIVVDAQPLRCGKQIRMIIGEVASTVPSPDAALIQLVTDAHRWFEDLRSGHLATIAEIAARDRQQVSHVSRTIGLAFLAPDLVDLILDGRQPATLTSERLKACRPLPMNWAEQRSLLLG